MCVSVGLYMCVPLCVCASMHGCTLVYVHARMSVCVPVNVYIVCMYVLLCVCT